MPQTRAFRTNFGPFIAAHWKEKFPEMAAKLEETDGVQLMADKRADKTAEHFSNAIRRGVWAEVAYEFCRQFWESPYEL